MGPRLSAAAFRLKHARPGYFVARWLRHRRRLLRDRGFVADPLQHWRGQPGIVGVEGGELADHAANRVRTVISTGGSSWAIAVTFEDPSGVYPSPISSAPTGFTILAGSSNQSSRWDRACLWRFRLASDDSGAVMMSALLHKTDIVS